MMSQLNNKEIGVYVGLKQYIKQDASATLEKMENGQKKHI